MGRGEDEEGSMYGSIFEGVVTSTEFEKLLSSAICGCGRLSCLCCDEIDKGHDDWLLSMLLL